MSDRRRLEQALIAADRAGDTEAARKLAQAIRDLPAEGGGSRWQEAPIVSGPWERYRGESSAQRPPPAGQNLRPEAPVGPSGPWERYRNSTPTDIPPLPPGFKLDQRNGVPPLPPGFKLDAQQPGQNPFDQFDAQPQGGNPFDQFDDAPADPYAQFQDAPAGRWQEAPIVGTREALKASNPGEYDPNSPEFKERFGATSGMSALDKFLAGTGKAFVDFGRGVRQVATQTGEATGILSPNFEQLITGRSRTDQLRQQQEEVNARDVELMESWYARGGNALGALAITAPALMVPGANTLAGAGAVGAGYGALQPTTQDGERLKNTAVGGAFGAGSQYVGGKVASYVSKKIAERSARAANAQAQNAVRDATLAEARKVGYVVPPSTSNPTVANRLIESASGKAATQQAASVRNQTITNRLVRQELGLGENVPLTRQTLESVRKQAGKAYEAVAGSGKVRVDDAYLDDLAKLADDIDQIAKDFPDANVGAGKEINKLVDSLLRDEFDARSAVEYVKQLRSEAASNLSFAAAADPVKRSLGHAQRDAAGALEDMVIRHLEMSGKRSLAKQFDSARQLIAKTYSVQSALNEGTGNVVARNLSAQLKKGKPLSGKLELVAKFGQAFPKAAEEVTTSPGVSAMDYFVGGVGGATIDPTLVALPVGRYAARSTALSSPYQAAFTTPSYSPRNALLHVTGTAGRHLTAPAIALAPYAAEQ